MPRYEEKPRQSAKSKLVVAALAIVMIPAALLVARSHNQSQDITYKQDPNASKRMTLLLKDFAPKPMLHGAVHEVPRAKFPVIDVHNHVNDPGGIHGDFIPPAQVIRRMDAANVRKIVILTGMWGDKLQGLLDKMVKPYPDRFMAFTQIDWSKIDDPNFSAEMVAQVDDAVKRGARGLKVLKDLGLGVKDKSGKLIAIDDPRIDPVWEECGRLNIPVAIHVTDPEAFFHPADKYNERYEELMSNPSWSFYGPQFPKKETLLSQRNPHRRKAPTDDVHRLTRCQLAGESRCRVGMARQVFEYVRGIRREASGTRPPAPARAEIFRGLSGPHPVRNGQRAGSGDVRESLPLAGDCG
jgi:hypothetical protein